MSSKVANATGNEQSSSPISAKRQHIRELCASVLVPLMVGLLTVAMAVVQLHTAQQQRKQDLVIAEQNRLKDMSIADQVREQDLLIANRLRWDAVLAAYIDDISTLVNSPNFSFTNIDSLMSSVIRAKTLTAGRQLDATRKAYLVQFLYDLKAVRVGENPIDLRDLELNNIDLSIAAVSNQRRWSLEGIALVGVSLINASFTGRYMVGADFTDSHLQNTNFDFANLRDVSFQRADLTNISFLLAKITNVDLSASDLEGSNITEQQLAEAYSILFATLPNGTMAHSLTFLINGDAEQENNCSMDQIGSMHSGTWQTNPPDSIGVMTIDPVVAEQAVRIAIAKMQKIVEKDHRHFYQNWWNMEQCSFVIDDRQYRAELFQQARIPTHYQQNNETYSWCVLLFCHAFEKDRIKKFVTLIQWNNLNETIGNETRQIPSDDTFSLLFPSFNKNTRYVTMTITFEQQDKTGDVNKSSETKYKPLGFCDNIHLSLELNSVIQSLISNVGLD